MRLKRFCTGFIQIIFLAIVCNAIPYARAAALDTIIFGNTSSETTHGLSTISTETYTGALSQPARRCLPLNPVDYYGGSLTFTMTVDPVRRNYFTVKLWSDDDTTDAIGRLYLYVPINGTDYQVGFRHEGDYMPLSVGYWKPGLTGRFFYSTTLLPLNMTQGKTSLTVKIVSAGRIYGLGSGGEKDGGNYQFLMDVNSRGIYRAYTHVDPFLDPTGEVQGTAPTTTVRPSPGSEVITSGGSFNNNVKNYINSLLAKTADTSFGAGDAAYLARAYSVSQVAAGYQNAAVATKVRDVIDAYATAYYGGTVTPDGWGGQFGPLGHAIYLLSTQLSSQLDTVVSYGTGGSKTRRQAWGDLLYASREYGRFNRNTLTNQNLISGTNIYLANKGLLVLGDSRAFTEDNGQRYLRESCGLSPWLGSDLSGGGSSAIFGTNYYQVTTKGLTREWGYVGKGYGEMAYYPAWFYELTGNTAFREQAIKMGHARAAFRRPGIEISGSNRYRTMEFIGLLAWRSADESDGEFGNETGYADRVFWSRGLRTAAVTLDPALVGYARQMLNDNQYFAGLIADYHYAQTLEALDVFNDCNVITAAADSGTRLPMTEGQPDFGWSDEEDRILAFKHGNDRMWITPYWQAKTGTGINGIARFQFSTASYTQYGVLETVPQFTLGGSFIRTTTDIDKPEGFQWLPPDPRPLQAYGGEVLPIGPVPAYATDNAPFRGKADFYAFRFGHYLMGINASETNSYVLKTPAGFTTAPDLISGSALSGIITVLPKSTVALYLPDAVDAAPVPGTPLIITTEGTDASIILTWPAASGATSYNVKRSDSFDGSFTTIASGVANTSYTDSTVTSASSHYYQVSAVNANGEGYDSTKVLGLTTGLPSPWSHTDIGTVGTAGSAAFNSINSSFIIKGAGSDIGSSSDYFHFGYMSMAGNGTMIGRFAGHTGNTTGSKMGLMMRESLASNSKSVDALWDDGPDQARLATRSSTGGSTTWAGGIQIGFPIWFKLVRNNSSFTGYYSSNGTGWTTLGSVSISMNNTIYVGPAVCSRNTSVLNTATFDNISVTGWLPKAPASLTAVAGNNSVSLDWNDNTESDLMSYKVWRATGTGGPYTLIASGVNVSNYVDNTVTNGTRYFYVVTAVDPVSNESAKSSEVTVIHYNGDLTFDGKVDMEDMAQLGRQWQTGYTLDSLQNIAHDWLMNDSF